MSDLKRQAEREAQTVTRKSRVQMKDAVLAIHPWRGTYALFGTPLNHPNDRLNNVEITTSKVIRHDGIEVETINTIYVVQNWTKPYGS